MEENTVPYIVYEGEQARNERNIKRLVTALIIAIVLIFASNAAWLYAWMQYDYLYESTTYSYEQDGLGTNIIGDRNRVNDGSKDESP